MHTYAFDFDIFEDEIEHARAELARSLREASSDLLLDSNVSPTLREIFRDFEARKTIVQLNARASEIDSMRSELIAIAERDNARKISLEKAVYDRAEY